jgi:hypothetical protein
MLPAIVTFVNCETRFPSATLKRHFFNLSLPKLMQLNAAEYGWIIGRKKDFLR